MAPVEMLADIIDASPSIATMMDALIGPILNERQHIRDHLHDEGHIHTLPTSSLTTSIACVDGALTSSPLAIGDHHCTLSVALTSTRGNVEVTDKRAWAMFLAHSPEADLLAKAVMLTNELILAATTSAEITLLDGSHATHVSAITDLLANATTRDTYNHYLDAVGGHQVVLDAVTHALTSPTVASQQKQDSSTNLWGALAATLNLTGTGLPDKPLASLILDEGEALTHPASTPSWHTVERNTRGATPGRLSGDLRAIIEPLADRHIAVSHVRPHASPFALRVEHKATDDTFGLLDMLAAISSDCAAPHVQEPFVQYLADKVAKSVSAAATLQLETARIDAATAGHPELVPYVLHYFRT